ncbi:hypothetical protein QM012_009147 [Aureobasidium pullulans]|uniref:Serine hydrolase domain-containing protein n=1 Tax=Aureobasidium pullulans TaxID=5580 RepID=A0ABR0TJJ2_AURPU
MAKGYGQNSEMMRLKMKALQKSIETEVQEQYPSGVDMDFADGPVDLLEDLGETSPVRLNAWWKALDDQSRYVELEASLTRIFTQLRERPVDAIIGFSQGAALAVMVAAILENTAARCAAMAKQGSPFFLPSIPQQPLKFVIAYSGFKGSPAFYSGFYKPKLTVAIQREQCMIQRRLRASTTPSRALQDDRGTQAINFFAHHYMLEQGIDGAPNPGLFGLFKPAFSSSSRDSSATMAVSALALSIYSRWRMDGVTEKRVANVLGGAIYKLSKDLNVEETRRNDNTLLATLTLQFHSSFESLFGSNKATIVHHLGALALVRGLGSPESWSNLAYQFVAYILHVEVAAAIREHRKVHPELCYWSSVITTTSNEPDSQIDALGIRVADIQVRADSILKTPDSNQCMVSSSPTLETLIGDIQDLDRCLVLWQERVSHSWGPFCWSREDVVFPPIQTFKGACHVYTSIRAARLLNIWRSYRLTLSLMSLQLLGRYRGQQLFNSDESHTIQELLTKRIQWLVDGFCASVPFFLGNRTKIGTVSDFDDLIWRFPTCHDMPELYDEKGLPAELKGLESTAHHKSRAIAQGVWLIMGNLTQLVAFFLSTASLTSRLPLRNGQLAWICQQYLRNLSLLSLPWTFNRALEEQVLTGVCLPAEEDLISEARRCVQRVLQGLKMTGD